MNKKTILFVSKSKHAPSTRYRALSYFSMLRDHGWTPIHQTLHGSFSRFRLLQNARKANVTVESKDVPHQQIVTLIIEALTGHLKESESQS